MQKENYLTSTSHKVNLFSTSLSPKERVHTLLIKHSKESSFELSVHAKENAYYTKYLFYLAIREWLRIFVFEKELMKSISFFLI